MIIDSNVIIQLANGSAPHLEDFVEEGGCSTASVVRIEVYGFKGITEKEKSALNGIFRPVAIHALNEAIIDRAIALRQSRKMGLGDAIISRHGP